MLKFVCACAFGFALGCFLTVQYYGPVSHAVGIFSAKSSAVSQALKAQ